MQKKKFGEMGVIITEICSKSISLLLIALFINLYLLCIKINTLLCSVIK